MSWREYTQYHLSVYNFPYHLVSTSYLDIMQLFPSASALAPVLVYAMKTAAVLQAWIENVQAVLLLHVCMSPQSCRSPYKAVGKMQEGILPS